MHLIDKKDYYKKLNETIWRSSLLFPKLLFEGSFVNQGLLIHPGKWDIK